MRFGFRVPFAVSLLILPMVSTLGAPAEAMAACPSVQTKQLAYQRAAPQGVADGARQRWIARQLVASDWHLGGFASEVLWVGTDSEPANTSGAWVEVGITHGFAGQSVYRFYTARQTAAGAYAEAMYLTMFPSVGSSYTFTVYSSGSSYAARVEGPSGTALRGWSGHAPNTVDYSGGLEATCNISRVDRTYVSLNQLRRKADGVFVNVNNGVLVDQSSDGGIAWCAQPTRFRYYLRSVIDPSQCS